jgi:thioredoxin reductase (NADPH)
MREEMPDVLIVGAGPAGLGVAIAAHQAGLDYEVLEKGALVNSIFNFPRNQIFFTTPELLEIGGLPFVTPYEKPTRVEALRYYRRVAETYRLRMSLGEEVLDIRPEEGAFRVETLPQQPRGRLGRAARSGARARSHQRRARNVVMACGYYDHPNRLGIPGEDLPHVSHYYFEAHAFYGQRVVVVGGKNSAALAALDLFRHGASVTLVHRGERLSDSVKYWIRPDIENRIKEGSIAARFSTCLTEITPDCVAVSGRSGHESLPAEAVFLLTGYHPDDDLLRRAGVRVDPVTYKPEHDPATFETNVRGLFVAGSLVSGKETSRIFIENGRFHGEAIVAAIRSGRR